MGYLQDISINTTFECDKNTEVYDVAYHHFCEIHNRFPLMPDNIEEMIYINMLSESVSDVYTSYYYEIYISDELEALFEETYPEYCV